MKKIITAIICILSMFNLFGQKSISFQAEDHVEVFADYYETFAESNKYMLMFHQAEYSRGEFQQIAERMIKLDFNCIAVDLRQGNEVNFVNNETALKAKQEKFNITLLSCEKDILAAINYVYSIDPYAQIFLMGSSFSGSLCLKVAKDRSDIKAVIAYSPGEFFSSLSITQYIKGLKVPTYIGCAQNEYSYVSQLAEGIESTKFVLFKPEGSNGLHGAQTLWWDSDTREECWLSLLFFLKDF
ncbi:MAG: dienelactone hydrolase family protein [Bacteroidales bacterium]|nr:dienelactone hydrolase family protein [Bacteroidales bacterium]